MKKTPELESESRLIVDSIPGIVALLSSTGDVEFVNPQLLEYFGQTLEELRQWGTNGTVHPEDLRYVAEIFTKSIGLGTPYEIVQRLRRADGAYRWMENKGFPLRDRNGQISRWCVLLTDIDERKRAEKAIQQSEQNLKLIIDTIPALVWGARQDGRAEFFNQHYLDYLGLTAEQAMDWAWTAAVHPGDLEDLKVRWRDILASGQTGEAEARLRRHDGAYRWFLFRANPLRNEQGKIIKWYGQNTDIEDRKQAEAELIRAYNSFADAQQLSKTGSFITDLLGDHHNWSEEAYRIFEFDPKTKVTVQRIRDIIHPEDLPSFDSVIERGMSGGNVHFEFRIVTERGETKYIHGAAHVIEQMEGRPMFVGALRDVTDSLAAEGARRETERQFKTIFDEAGAGITLVDLKMGEPIRNNRALQKTLGCSEEELSRFETYEQLTHPVDREKDSATFRELCEGKRDSLKLEKHFVLKDGRSIWANVIFTLLRGDDGQPRYIIAIHEDITERKLALERLQANQDLLDLAQKSAGAMAFDWYIQQDTNHWSPEQEALFGLPPGAFDGSYKSWKKMMYAPDWPTVVEAIQHAHKTGVVEAEYRVVWPDGSLHWLSTNGRMFFDEKSEPLRMVGFTSDVTRRKTAEVRLAGEKRLLEMVATGRSLIEILSALCTYVEEIAPECQCGLYLMDWDPPIVQLVVGPTLPAGYNAALEGLRFNPETGPCALAAHQGIQVIAADVESDRQWRSSPFRTYALAHGLKSCWSTPIFSQAGLVLGTFAIYQDKPAKPTLLQQDLIAQVTHIASIAIESRQREEALRRSEAFLAEGQRLSLTGSFVWCPDTDEIVFSDELQRIFEFEPGMPVTIERIVERVHPDDLSLVSEKIEQARTGSGDHDYEVRIKMPDGSTKYLHTNARATRRADGNIEFVGAMQDVTQRRDSEEALSEARSELARAGRAASLSVLTASIAHEVNQPLSGIITNASTCVRMLDADPPNVDGARETARRTIRDGNRASEVIKRLRALFSKREFTPESLDLNELAQEVIVLSRNELQRSEVVLQSEFAKDLPPVDADRVQLQQVILNLLLNAADAVGDVDEWPRQITVKTRLERDDQVRLSVCDMGVGFTAEGAEKLFDAFYTTKKNGMGIGLSVSRSIIERHRGRLWAEPNEGPGAVFSFSLPVKGTSEASHTREELAEDRNFERFA